MKVLEIRWVPFMHSVLSWMGIPAPAREILSQPTDPDRVAVEYLLHDYHDILLEQEFLRRLATGRIALNKECKPFLRIIRALKANTALGRPSADVFITYLSNYLTHEERNALWGRPGHWRNDEELFRTVARLPWLNDFLAADGSEWESRYHRSYVPPYFEIPETLAMAQRLVKDCMERKEPIALRELPDLYGGLDADLVDTALMGCIRYLLLFPWLRAGDGEPVFGIWPGIVKRLNAKPPEAPRAVEPEETFHAPFLSEDMTTLLVAAAAEPFRLRVNDGYLFAKTQKVLAKNLLPLPDWLSASPGFGLDDRIRRAFDHLHALYFISRVELDGKTLHAEITRTGRAWLQLSAKERWRRILDAAREAAANFSIRRTYVDAILSWLAVTIRLSGKGDPSVKLHDEFRRQLSTIPTNAFWMWSDFSEYYAANNAFADRLKKRSNVTGDLGGCYYYQMKAEDIEELWPRFLDRILAGRLFPLGAVKVGHVGRETCVSLTDAGRYLFGSADDFEFEEAPGGGVLVQPNFEVAFLAPNPAAEAEIGRFAERKGRQVGILFVITKESVMRAAASGSTASAALETLERFGTKAVPANVRREIEGWFGACRRISVRSAVLIHCPDPETTTRVLGVAHDKAERLTDTVVELRDPGGQAGLLRKLRAMGIFG